MYAEWPSIRWGDKLPDGRQERSKDDDGLGRRAGRPASGPQVVNDTQDALGDRPRRQPARPGHPRRHRPGPAGGRSGDHVPVRDRRPRPDGRPGAAHPRRGRARDGSAAGPRPRPVGDGHASYARHHAGLHRHVRGARHPPGSLLLDERDLRRPATWTRTSGWRSTGRPRARHLSPRRQRPASRRLASAPGGLRELRQGGDDDRHDVGRRAGLLRVPPEPRHLGPGCGASGWIVAVRRPRQAAAGTSNGPPSGACSGSRSSRVARTSRRPAGRATARTRSPARCSSASRRSTCRTSS